MRGVISAALTLVMASAVANAQTTAVATSQATPSSTGDTAPSAHLSSGTYRFAGRCAKMTVTSHDVTPDCGTTLGIIANDPNRPTFVIVLRDGKTAWEYQVIGAGVLSDDGKVMTYAISSMIDLEATADQTREYTYPGECVNSVRVGEPLLRCTMWSDDKRTEVTREVIFEGNGTWAFSRAAPGQ
jgi:hypothetical protein